jgi:GDP-L-fucose synthase
MVGHAIVRVLPHDFDVTVVGSKDYDLRDPVKARKMIRDTKPKKIIHLAARVGGVKANTDYVADFFNENILINTNVLMAAHKYDVQNVVSLLSTCVFPDRKWVSYPLTEAQLHNGPPHESNFGYAHAKRMIEVQSRAYRQQYNRNYTTAIPNNIYGPYDNFDLEAGHVAAAVVRRIYEARESGIEPTFWGDGSPLREFTHADDIACCLLKMAGCPDGEVYDSEIPCNIGTNEEVSIKYLVETAADVFGYEGPIEWDTSKPAGQFRKPSYKGRIPHKYCSLREGLEKTCKWFEANYPDVRGV